MVVMKWNSHGGVVVVLRCCGAAVLRCGVALVLEV